MEVIFIIYLVLVILNIIYVKSYKSLRNFKYKHEINKNGELFNRDIEVKYSPSIVSYLYNQKIEPEKDIIVDIFNLYARKIINIKKTNNEDYVLELNDTNYLEATKKNIIFENDIYIINSIILKKFKFRYEEWLKTIINVYREKLNKKEKKGLSELVNTDYKAIIIFTAFITMIINLFFNQLGIISICFFLSVVIFLIVNKFINRDENQDMHLNNETKEELKKWLRFENFIKENILIKHKKFEEIVLYEQYIPFAMVLNINTEYKKEMLRVLNKKEVDLIFDSVNDYKNNKNLLNY